MNSGGGGSAAAEEHHPQEKLHEFMDTFKTLMSPHEEFAGLVRDTAEMQPRYGRDMAEI